MHCLLVGLSRHDLEHSSHQEVADCNLLRVACAQSVMALLTLLYCTDQAAVFAQEVLG